MFHKRDEDLTDDLMFVDLRSTGLCVSRSEEEISIDAHLESILASECTMIVLDTIETIIQVSCILSLFQCPSNLIA